MEFGTLRANGPDVIVIGTGRIAGGLIGRLHAEGSSPEGGRQGIVGVAITGNYCEELRRAPVTVVEVEPDAPVTTHVTEYVEVLTPNASQNERHVLYAERFREAEISVVATSVTTKAYCLNSKGKLDLGHPLVARDLESRRVTSPSTLVGALVLGLHQRFCRSLDDKNGDYRMVVIPCENYQSVYDQSSERYYGLGDHLKAALLDFAREKYHDQLFNDWISRDVFVPNTQVDRICSNLSEEGTSELLNSIGVGPVSGRVVVTEPYHKLVIENSVPRDLLPNWLKNNPNVTLTSEIHEWNDLKLFALNQTHVLVAWISKYFEGEVQKRHVHDVLAIPHLRDFLEDTLKKSLAKVLRVPGGVDLENYVERVLKRFQNPLISDSLERLDTQGCKKFRERVAPVAHRLEARTADNEEAATTNNLLARYAFFIATWIRCVTTGVDKQGREVNATRDDDCAKLLRAQFKDITSDAESINQLLEQARIDLGGIGRRWIEYFLTNGLSDKDLNEAIDFLMDPLATQNIWEKQILGAQR